MKIRITSPGMKIPIEIRVPLWLGGIQILRRTMEEYLADEGSTEAVSCGAEMISLSMDAVRKYVRENGHFSFLEVETADGTNVCITV